MGICKGTVEAVGITIPTRPSAATGNFLPRSNRMKVTGEKLGEKINWQQPEGMEKYFERPGRQRGATGIAREILSPEERRELGIHSLAGGSKKVATGIGRRLAYNPLPVALAGVGISWLLLMGRDELPAHFGSLTEEPRLRGRRHRSNKERLDIAADLVLTRSTEVGARLARLAKEKPFALGTFAFSVGAVLGVLMSGKSGDGRLPGEGKQVLPVATRETADLTAHSEIRGQAGGFGPEETETEMEMEPE
jgi:hypothetical protein